MSAPRVGLVGPLPPPAGGMANQTRQLARLLGESGVAVTLVQTNAPYAPAWLGRVRGLRAVGRLGPYLLRLWRAAGGVDVFHVMANSGWSWHLFAAPAVWMARARGVGVIVNYRGGGAGEFFRTSMRSVRPTLARADLVVTPSGFLREVFATHDVAARVIPNVIDLERFTRKMRPFDAGRPHLLVARNLEAIYDVATALRAFAAVRVHRPGARLTVAGEGPERAALESLAASLGVADAVRFTGRLDNEHMAALYQEADLALNSSRVDNMPISILEALASGVPVVSTDVGGIPFMVTDGEHARLVPPGDPAAMARAVLALVDDAAGRDRLVANGLRLVQAYAWANVRGLWLAAYREAARNRLEPA